MSTKPSSRPRKTKTQPAASAGNERVVLGVWPYESTAQKHARAQAKSAPGSEPEVVPQKGGFAVYINASAV